MPLAVKSKIALFAYLYKIIKSLLDTFALQNDINQLTKWEKLWSMEFHPDKCFVLRVTNEQKCIDADYSIHNQKLEHVDHANYLGVTISKNLSWKKHVQRITAKATNTRLFLQIKSDIFWLWNQTNVLQNICETNCWVCIISLGSRWEQHTCWKDWIHSA